jgi:hypothetical protein
MKSTIECPLCHKEMEEFEKSTTQAGKYQDCYRRCESCRIGASNAKKAHTYIYESFQKNLPEWVGNIDYVLEHAINETHRTDKKNKIAFFNSEDALTLAFFYYFVVDQKKMELLAKLFQMGSGIKDVLLWGVSVKQTCRLYTEQLREICKTLGENKKAYSEPDVIIIGENEIIFIEVKFRSGNANTKKKDKFLRYLSNDYYQSSDFAVESGLYELVRNWTIGNMFAHGTKFRLINLGFQNLFAGKKATALSVFESSLKVTEKRRFEKLSWESVLQKLKNDVDCCFLADLVRRLG